MKKEKIVSISEFSKQNSVNYRDLLGQSKLKTFPKPDYASGKNRLWRESVLLKYCLSQGLIGGENEN